jgi:hypothetical protein
MSHCLDMIKLKIRSHMDKEELEEFRKVEEGSVEEIYKSCTIKYCQNYLPTQDTLEGHFFKAGFKEAKKVIRQFLIQKQMGYGETFLFKMSDFDEMWDGSNE